jgi:hypothetical protein
MSVAAVLLIFRVRLTLLRCTRFIVDLDDRSQRSRTGLRDEITHVSMLTFG